VRHVILLVADQDSVRLLAVESCGAFAAALSKEDCASSLLPVVQKFAQVCYMLPTGLQSAQDLLCFITL
jgi:hypothetical protein